MCNVVRERLREFISLIHLQKGKSFTVSDALFIIVTDFGSEGLTAGKSLREMENFIDEEVKQMYVR